MLVSSANGRSASPGRPSPPADPPAPPLYLLAAMTLGEAVTLLESAVGELQSIEPTPALEGRIRRFLGRVCPQEADPD